MSHRKIESTEVFNTTLVTRDPLSVLSLTDFHRWKEAYLRAGGAYR